MLSIRHSGLLILRKFVRDQNVGDRRVGAAVVAVVDEPLVSVLFRKAESRRADAEEDEEEVEHQGTCENALGHAVDQEGEERHRHRKGVRADRGRGEVSRVGGQMPRSHDEKQKEEEKAEDPRLTAEAEEEIPRVGCRNTVVQIFRKGRAEGIGSDADPAEEMIAEEEKGGFQLRRIGFRSLGKEEGEDRVPHRGGEKEDRIG